MTGSAYPKTISAALAALENGSISSYELTNTCLDRIADTAGEGSRAFLTVYKDLVVTAAEASDRRVSAGLPRRALEGIPISIKDLFDVAGEPTTAGSVVLRGAEPAEEDAAVVRRLRAAGAVIIGKTNMTEFAYSALGSNAHYGTPLAPYDRLHGRVPGGSSAGGAVSVSDGMAFGAIGSDTGGSTRIPAAFCGITGFKPTQGRVPLQGAFPLAPSFDSIGPLGWDVADCRRLDSVLSGECTKVRPRRLQDLRLGLASGLPLHDLDAPVADAYERALETLRAAGARLLPIEGIDWSALMATAAEGRITACECRARHGEIFSQREAYDPNIARRIEAADGFPATAYIAAKTKLAALRAVLRPLLYSFDAILMPTVACLPPKLSDIASEEGFVTANAKSMRNTFLINLLDGCAISLPIGDPDGPPVGLMLAAGPHRDAPLFDIASCIEKTCAPYRVDQ